MNSILEEAARRFVAPEHLRNVLAGAWTDLHAEDGSVLPGIRGRVGACGTTVAGHEFGADLIEMAPGSAFALHTHPGDHLLYIVTGRGFVHIDGRDRRAEAGDTVFIAGGHPHGVKTDPTYHAPFAFLAVGHPHKPLAATDRMTLVPPPG